MGCRLPQVHSARIRNSKRNALPRPRFPTMHPQRGRAPTRVDEQQLLAARAPQPEVEGLVLLVVHAGVALGVAADRVAPDLCVWVVCGGWVRVWGGVRSVGGMRTESHPPTWHVPQGMHPPPQYCLLYQPTLYGRSSLSLVT